MELESDNRREKLPWSACFGAIVGLVVGVVTTMWVSAWLHDWIPEGRTAELVWGIGSPLMGFLGVVGGFALFQRYIRDLVILAGFLCLVFLVLGYWMVFYWIGFPWKGVGYGV